MARRSASCHAPLAVSHLPKGQDFVCKSEQLAAKRQQRCSRRPPGYLLGFASVRPALAFGKDQQGE